MSILKEIMATDEQYYVHVFKRLPVCFDHGEGTVLYDLDGNRYLDFLAGIAVNALGHAHPKMVAAIKAQAEKLIHCSNLYYIRSQTELAKKLLDRTCLDKVFFSNSGAEANEAALKLAKIYHYKNGAPDRYHFITASASFHGRTLATVAATAQEHYQKPYRPIVQGFSHVPFNDFDAIKAIASKELTAAIMLELVQGESGVHPADYHYIQKVAKLCKDLGILLIIDEIQTGLGRTGKLFAYEHYDVEPDIMTLAKALGCGFPIGAMLAKDSVAQAFGPGDHGSTYAGGPLACAVAGAALDVILDENLPNAAAEKGAYIVEKLKLLRRTFPVITEIRSKGLMVACQFGQPIAGKVQASLFDAGCLAATVGDSILRMLPPLNVKTAEIDEFIEKLSSALAEAV